MENAGHLFEGVDETNDGAPSSCRFTYYFLTSFHLVTNAAYTNQHVKQVCACGCVRDLFGWLAPILDWNAELLDEIWKSENSFFFFFQIHLLFIYYENEKEGGIEIILSLWMAIQLLVGPHCYSPCYSNQSDKRYW